MLSRKLATSTNSRSSIIALRLAYVGLVDYKFLWKVILSKINIFYVAHDHELSLPNMIRKGEDVQEIMSATSKVGMNPLIILCE